VVGGAQQSGQLRLGALAYQVQDVDLEASLDAEQCCQQSDGSGARDQRARQRAAGLVPDAVDLLPSLGDDAGRLGQYPEQPQ
jgi:hypothetical protein